MDIRLFIYGKLQLFTLLLMIEEAYGSYFDNRKANRFRKNCTWLLNTENRSLVKRFFGLKQRYGLIIIIWYQFWQWCSFSNLVGIDKVRISQSWASMYCPHCLIQNERLNPTHNGNSRPSSKLSEHIIQCDKFITVKMGSHKGLILKMTGTHIYWKSKCHVQIIFKFFYQKLPLISLETVPLSKNGFYARQEMFLERHIFFMIVYWKECAKLTNFTFGTS